MPKFLLELDPKVAELEGVEVRNIREPSSHEILPILIGSRIFHYAIYQKILKHHPCADRLELIDLG